MSKLRRLDTFEVPSKQYIFRRRLYISDCEGCGILADEDTMYSLKDGGWVDKCDGKSAHPISVSVGVVEASNNSAPYKVFVGWCEEVTSDEDRLA